MKQSPSHWHFFSILKFKICIIEFEDRFFRWHPGVNPFAVVRAVRDNISSGKVVSGASTITMQVARMSRQKERTLWQKMLEAILATRMELRYSKDEILAACYSFSAPMGLFMNAIAAMTAGLLPM